MESNNTLKQTKKVDSEQPQFLKSSSGLYMILLGAIFLALNYFSGRDGFGGKAWLLFLLLPVYWVAMSSYKQYVENGRQLTAKVITPLMWGLFPFVFVTLMTLGVPVQFLWPLVLVVIGVTMLAKRD